MTTQRNGKFFIEKSVLEGEVELEVVESFAVTENGDKIFVLKTKADDYELYLEIDSEPSIGFEMSTEREFETLVEWSNIFDIKVLKKYLGNWVDLALKKGEVEFDLIFDNAGGMRVQTDNFSMGFIDPSGKLATDCVRDLLAGASADGWEGNEPDAREDDLSSCVYVCEREVKEIVDSGEVKVEAIGDKYCYELVDLFESLGCKLTDYDCRRNRLDIFAKNLTEELTGYEICAGIGNGDIALPEWASKSESTDSVKIWDDENGGSQQSNFKIFEV